MILAQLGSTVFEAAQSAFTDGVHAAAATGALVLTIAAVAAATLLRGIEVNPASTDDGATAEPAELDSLIGDLPPDPSHRLSRLLGPWVPRAGCRRRRV